MRKAGLLFTVTLLVLYSALALFKAPATAITSGPQPSSDTSTPSILITSVVGTSMLEDLEIYNQSSSPVNLEGWSFAFTISGDGACSSGKVLKVSFPAGWILSKHYLTFERNGDPESTTPFSVDSTFLNGCVNSWLSSVELLDNNTEEQTVNIPTSTTLPSGNIAQHKQRGNSASSARTVSGVFSNDYKVSAITNSTSLFNDPLYLPPNSDGGLEILEILPNAKTCQPLDPNPTCGDYIKFYNPTAQPINLALFRLRIGYKGQSASITNTFTWNQDLDPISDVLVLQPHGYFMLVMRNDGQLLSIPDDGDYIWIEDAYGVKTYSPIVQYPSASSTTKAGWAWALAGSNWKWTSAPRPDGPNSFPPTDPVVQSATTTSALKPCASNQYRNPATNRCKLITTSTSSLVPCKPNQERNPQTHHCKSIVTTGSTLKPCQAGWTRNPETNRCRKSTTASVANVQDIRSPTATTNHLTWLIAGGAVGLALIYAIYEWRQEISLKIAEIKSKFSRQTKIIQPKIIHPSN